MESSLLLHRLFPGNARFFAYDLEKRISRHSQKFGQGIIEGVAGAIAVFVMLKYRIPEEVFSGDEG